MSFEQTQPTYSAAPAADDHNKLGDNWRNELQFPAFFKRVSQAEIEISTTANGVATIQQSARNVLRKDGIAALKHDLQLIYPDLEIVETKEGIVLVAENIPSDFTFSWELKSTIKSVDYDPFVEANNFDEANEIKESKKAAKDSAKAARQEALAKKRAEKLQQLNKNKLANDDSVEK